MLSRVQQGRAAERNDRRFLHPRGGLAKQIYLPSLMKRPNLAVHPWVVGVRGVTDTAGIREAMEFLGIPSSQWSTILRKSAVASVEALEYLHKLRNSPQQFLPPEQERASVASGKRKRAGTTSTLERWRRLATDPVRRSFQDHGRTSTRQLGKRAHAETRRQIAGDSWTDTLKGLA